MHEHGFLGPKMCTTLAKEGNMSGNEACGMVDNVTGEFIEGSIWHSCEEWCLSKVNMNTHISLKCIVGGILPMDG